jgi:TolA-binding protein
VADSVDGREIASTEVRGEAQQQNESQTGVPEYPAPSEVRQMAISKALGSARKLYAPWVDRREVPIMDNKECNLRQAYDAVKSGDYPGFLQLSRQNVEACVDNPKLAGAAWYNLGVALVLAGKYEEALAVFGEAEKARGPKPPQDLLELCRVESAGKPK